MNLSKKQKLFCKEFLVDLNATQAAIRACYSKKTARKIGSENLSKPDIRNEINRLMQKRSDKLEVTSDSVLNKIKKHEEASVKDHYDEEGKLIPIHLLPNDVASCIQEVSGDRYKLVDKTKNLELLGKHLKLFTEKREVTNPDGVKVALSPELQDLVDKITKRAADARDKD